MKPKPITWVFDLRTPQIERDYFRAALHRKVRAELNKALAPSGSVTVSFRQIYGPEQITLCNSLGDVIARFYRPAGSRYFKREKTPL
jgi:hypothetical protein